MNVLALDDEKTAIDILDYFCANSNLIESFKGFTSTIDAFNYLEKNPIDLIIVDINMPTISGLKFVKTLPYPVEVIFATAYNEYAIDAFDIEAVDYLLKPINIDRFNQSIERAHRKIKSTQTDPFYKVSLKLDYGITQIKTSSIRYIEAYDDYIKIHCENNVTKVIRSTMKAIIHRLPEGQFIRIHKSYIVPIKEIQKIRNKKVYLDEIELPIGPSYSSSIRFLLDNENTPL